MFLGYLLSSVHMFLLKLIFFFFYYYYYFFFYLALLNPLFTLIYSKALLLYTVVLMLCSGEGKDSCIHLHWVPSAITCHCECIGICVPFVLVKPSCQHISMAKVIFLLSQISSQIFQGSHGHFQDLDLETLKSTLCTTENVLWKMPDLVIELHSVYPQIGRLQAFSRLTVGLWVAQKQQELPDTQLTFKSGHRSNNCRLCST